MIITVQHGIEGANGVEVLYEVEVELTPAEPETRDNPGADAYAFINQIKLLNGTEIVRGQWLHHGFTKAEFDEVSLSACEHAAELEDEDRATKADVEEARRSDR